jgi:hypothetical protein
MKTMKKTLTITIIMLCGIVCGYTQNTPLHAASIRTWNFGNLTWSDAIHNINFVNVIANEILNSTAPWRGLAYCVGIQQGGQQNPLSRAGIKYDSTVERDADKNLILNLVWTVAIGGGFLYYLIRRINKKGKWNWRSRDWWFGRY